MHHFYSKVLVLGSPQVGVHLHVNSMKKIQVTRGHFRYAIIYQVNTSATHLNANKHNLQAICVFKVKNLEISKFGSSSPLHARERRHRLGQGMPGMMNYFQNFDSNIRVNINW